MSASQDAYERRCEWGEHGVALLAAAADAIVIVDVLSFSTAVSVVIDRGGEAIPQRWKDASAAERAHARGALLAGPRGSGFSLSPASMLELPEGAAIVIPSPNGSTLSLATGSTPTYAGCLRNARAVARAAARHGRRVAVIPAGERWPDDRLRPSFEDLIGAGAILRALPGAPSPDAEAAMAAFEAVADDLEAALQGCASGRELIGIGFAEDVALAAQLDASPHAPRLEGDAYVRETPEVEPASLSGVLCASRGSR